MALAAPLAPLPVRARQLHQIRQPADAQLVPVGVHRGGAGQFGPDDRLDQGRAPLDVAFDDGGVERLDVIDVQHALQVDVLDVHGNVSSCWMDGLLLRVRAPGERRCWPSTADAAAAELPACRGRAPVAHPRGSSSSARRLMPGGAGAWSQRVRPSLSTRVHPRGAAPQPPRGPSTGE